MFRLARWLCAVLGGVILGSGLVLHGQVAMARYMREEVDSTFFLWRAIGRATFAFQGGDTRMALAMSDVPEAALRESDRAGWVLVIVGSLIALTGPLLRGGKMPTGKQAPKHA
jgi:uncharacterized protein YjeT (DUF2065 family)